MAQQLVLVADDNPDVRLIFRTILETNGFAVIDAVNGGEAVELAERHRPDLVFMDLMMPGMDGWQAVAELRARGPDTAGIPVAAVTAYDPPSERIREAGFCALLKKPLAPAQVVRAARVCLEADERGERWVADLAERLRSGSC